MSKSEIFPCEMGQGCEGCNVVKCPLISEDHRKAILEERALKQMELSDCCNDDYECDQDCDNESCN
jgi:hypothetical protein